jgi:hypothetical protein
VADSHSPDWTDFNDHDPGVSLLELMAWLAETGLYRLNAVPEAGQAAATRLRAALAGLSAVSAAPCEPLARPNFFNGLLLDAATLSEEQSYLRAKSRRHNLHLHGWGVVQGLAVSLDSGGSSGQARVHVGAGFGIDASGEEVHVCKDVQVRLPQTPRRLLITLRHHDLLSDPVPSATRRQDFARVCDVSVIGLVSELAYPAIPLGTLDARDGQWRLEEAFKPKYA